MFKKIVSLLSLSAIILILASFTIEPFQSNVSDPLAGKINLNLNQTGKKYEVKSGIVDYKSTTMGMAQTITIYFDDYGAKEATESTMSMMGMKISQLNFIKDGYSYSVDHTNKIATKTKITEPDLSKINYNELSEEMIREMKLTKLGKETILGKECEKMSIDWAEMSMKGMVWVWKGIALKSDITVMGMAVIMEATSIKTDVAIPADKFTVPTGYKITEL